MPYKEYLREKEGEPDSYGVPKRTMYNWKKLEVSTETSNFLIFEKCVTSGICSVGRQM